MNKEAEQKKESKKSDFCTCKCVTLVYSDTESCDFGYWDVCSKCNKRLEDGFHYYNHCDGEDYDDVDLYCQ